MKIGLDDIYVWVVLALAGLVLLNVILMFYLAYFRMKEVLGYLGNSPAVIGRSVNLSLDPLVRFSLLGHVSMMLTIPRRSIHKGLLDAKDYERFPRRLKAFIQFCNGSAWLLFVLLAVMYALYR
ncbi:hypothetical protein [Pseudomonas sp. CLCA07]